VRLQEREFSLEPDGYTATRHQREVGAGYFDQVMQAIAGGESSTLALNGSTEEAQFEGEMTAAVRRASNAPVTDDARRVATAVSD
jgi:isocitrate lyase